MNYPNFYFNKLSNFPPLTQNFFYVQYITFYLHRPLPLHWLLLQSESSQHTELREPSPGMQPVPVVGGLG